MANNQNKGNKQQAPKLAFKGNKFNKTKGFYQIPQELGDIICKTFARQPAPLRLMLVLIGTDPGFGLAEKWIVERTGLTHAAYIKTKDLLEEMGWIHCEKGKIEVDFDTIYGRIESIPQMDLETDDQECIESILQKSENETNCIESIPQKDDKKQDSIESIPQKNCIQSIPQKGRIESIPQKDGGYSINTPDLYSVNTSKEELGYSVNTENCIESIPIIYNKEIENLDIDKLEYITMGEISRLVEPPVWLTEEIVKLANGKIFRFKKPKQDWASIF